jgi:nitrite reductase/ring-hydroxylating ferredoxin subunit
MSGTWERICRIDEVVPDQPLARVVGESGQDRDRVCVVAPDGGNHVAMLDRCPHRDVALSGGIVKDGTLTCPGHFWRFDITTGERTDLPERRATVYPTRVVDGWVEALLPPARPRRSMREWLLAEARRDPTAPVGGGSRADG